MPYINIIANAKYTISQQMDGEIDVFKYGEGIEISDPELVMNLALTIRDLQEIIEIYRNYYCYSQKSNEGLL